jgi:type II secretory pathway component PulJ
MSTDTITSDVGGGDDEVRQQHAPTFKDKLLTLVPMLVAIALLAAYLFISYRLFGAAATLSDASWERAMLLYGGFEAIVLTAVGFLFGQEVHRARAERAEEEATDNQQEAVDAVSAAKVARLKKQTLRNAILNSAGPNRAFIADPEARLEQLRLLATSLED